MILPEDTLVDLFLEEGRVHLRMVPSDGAAPVRVIVAVTPKSTIVSGGQKLRAGQWQVEPENVGLELVLSPLPSLPEETNLKLAENSSVFFESNGNSALVGDQNTLVIARTKASIPLSGSRLELDEISFKPGSGRLAVDWKASNDPSLDLRVSGQSKKIRVYSNYSDLAANEAISPLDLLLVGRSTKSLLSAAAAFTAFFALPCGAHGLYNTGHDNDSNSNLHCSGLLLGKGAT